MLLAQTKTGDQASVWRPLNQRRNHQRKSFSANIELQGCNYGTYQGIIENTSAKDDSHDEKNAKQKAKENALFHLIFEQSPLDESADSALTMNIKSLKVDYNPQFVVEVASSSRLQKRIWNPSELFWRRQGPRSRDLASRQGPVLNLRARSTKRSTLISTFKRL